MPWFAHLERYTRQAYFLECPPQLFDLRSIRVFWGLHIYAFDERAQDDDQIHDKPSWAEKFSKPVRKKCDAQLHLLYICVYIYTYIHVCTCIIYSVDQYSIANYDDITFIYYVSMSVLLEYQDMKVYREKDGEGKIEVIEKC